MNCAVVDGVWICSNARSFTFKDILNSIGSLTGILVLLITFSVLTFVFFYLRNTFEMKKAEKQRLKAGDEWAREKLKERGTDPDLNVK